MVPVASDHALVSDMTAKFGCSLRTIQRDIAWAMASELPPFVSYQKGRPLNLWQQQALAEIRQGRNIKLPSYEIAERVEALGEPRLVRLDEVAEWLRRCIPAEHRDRFIKQLYEDLGA